MRSRRPVVALALVASLVVALAARSALAQDAGEARRLTFVVPDPDNLQYLVFWVALGGGFFAREGLAIELRVPKMPVLVDELVNRDDFEAAALPPPVYLELVSQGAPVVVVANLLANDGINLVARRDFVAARGLSPTAPLKDRLASLRGARIGVAPGPARRLDALFASQGLTTAGLVERVVVPGPDQNDAFAKGKVDVLFAHTPYLERALADQDGVLLVNVSAGEVPSLAHRQIHTVVVARALATAHPEVVDAIVRAVLGAEQLVHRDPKATADAIATALPSLERRLVERLLPIYEPAVPNDPRVFADALAPAADLFPARRRAPDLSGKDLGAFVDSSFAERAIAEAARRATAAPAPRRWRAWVVAAGALAVIAAVGVAVRRRRAGRAASPHLYS